MSNIKFKQIGQNVIVVIEGNETPFTKKFTEKVDRENIKTLIETYNAKPTKKVLDTITKIMTKNSAEKQEQIKTAKAVERNAKKEEKIVDKVALPTEQTKEVKAKVATHETNAAPKPQVEEEGNISIKDILLLNPLFLDETDYQVDKVSKLLLPYQTGIEIECDRQKTFDITKFEQIPDIIDINIDGTEQRFRIPEGLKGFKCLFNICETLKTESIPNSDAGHHYHIDFTDTFDLVTKEKIKENENYILAELTKWDYQGTYNRKQVSLDGGGIWCRFQTYFKTMEVRIGDMSFDYSYIIKRILHCQEIAKNVKRNLKYNIEPIKKEPKDNIKQVINDRKILI